MAKFEARLKKLEDVFFRKDARVLCVIVQPDETEAEAAERQGISLQDAGENTIVYVMRFSGPDTSLDDEIISTIRGMLDEGYTEEGIREIIGEKIGAAEAEKLMARARS